MKKASYKIGITSRQILFILLFANTLAVIVAIAGAIALDKSPSYYFDELDRGGFITGISCLQLLIAAVLSWKTFKIVRSSPQLTKNSLFWLIITIGLFFLAIDDGVGLHEYADYLIHESIGLSETEITDLIDDLIVGSYIVLFLIYVAAKWKTITIFRQSFIYFKIGFILAVIMVVLDVVSNNTLFVSMIIDDATIQSTTQDWLGILEDSAKIFAEGMFITGIYKCRQIARSVDRNQ